MTELDSLFKLDGDLDSLDKNLHEKYAYSFRLFPSRATLTSPESKPSPPKPKNSKPSKPASAPPKTASNKPSPTPLRDGKTRSAAALSKAHSPRLTRRPVPKELHRYPAVDDPLSCEQR